MQFEPRKNDHGVWMIHFGRLAVKGIRVKRTADRLCRVLNAEADTVKQAVVVEASIVPGETGKLWHLAAGAIIAAKSGEPSDVQALGSLLWNRVKGLS